VTELTGGIDELKVNFFQSGSSNLGNEGLSEGEDSLLRTDAATLDEEEIILDDTVVGETTQRSDGLFGKISTSTGVVLSAFVSDTLSDSVYLLVDFGSVMVTVLTRSGNGPGDLSRMPSTDATDSSKTSVSLSGESLGSESVGGTFVTSTLSDTDNIDHFVLLEDVINAELLFEVGVSPVDLGRDITTVDLNFLEVSLLLSKVEEVHLGVDEDSDDGAVLLHSLKLDLDGLSTFVVLLGVLGEALSLGVHPVLVESSLNLVTEMLSPDGSECSETTGSIDVSDDTDNNNGGSFNDGTSLDDFLLVQFGSGSVHGSDDVSHTSLETWEGGKVDGL